MAAHARLSRVAEWSWGTIAVAMVAASLTAGDAIVLLRYTIAPIWLWAQVPVLILAWIAPVAWSRSRWLLAGVCLLAMLGGLWGYLYVPPLLALILAGIAFFRAAR